MKFALLLGCVLLVSGCTKNAPEETVTKHAPTTKTTENTSTKNQTQEQELEAAFAKVKNSIAAKSATEFQQVIDKDFGLYIIQTPGAVPQIHQVYHISDFREQNTQQDFFSLPRVNSSCTLVFEEFPKFSCETFLPGQSSGFLEDGCFASTTQKLTAANLFDYVEIKPADAKKMVSAAEKIRYAILDTKTHLKYYFGKINGSWKLLFVNISQPCSA